MSNDFHFADVRVSTNRLAAKVLNAGYGRIIVPEIDDVFSFGNYLRERMTRLAAEYERTCPQRWATVNPRSCFDFYSEVLKGCTNGIAVCQLVGDGTDHGITTEQIRDIEFHTQKPMDIWTVYYTGQLPAKGVMYEKTAAPQPRFH